MSSRKPNMNKKYGSGNRANHRLTRRKAKQMLGCMYRKKTKPQTAKERKLDEPVNVADYRCGHNFPPEECRQPKCGLRDALKENANLRAELANLDNPGMLELILDTKKLCSCTNWCEHCIGDTARRLVKACLGLRAKVASLESDLKACEECGDEATAVYHSNETLLKQISERDQRIKALEAQVQGHCERIAAQSALLSKKAEKPT